MWNIKSRLQNQINYNQNFKNVYVIYINIWTKIQIMYLFTMQTNT